jgi:hypothetical protein
MALQGKANQNDKILITGRTNGTATSDTPSINFKHNKIHGYKTRIGIDTDYSTADDSGVHGGAGTRRSTNVLMGNKGLLRSGGTGGNVKSRTNYTQGRDIFETAATSTTLALGISGQLLYVSSGAIKARMNPVTMTTHLVKLTSNGSGNGKDADTSPGLGTYNSSVVFYSKTSAAAGVATNTLTLSTSK